MLRLFITIFIFIRRKITMSHPSPVLNIPALPYINFHQISQGINHIHIKFVETSSNFSLWQTRRLSSSRSISYRSTYITIRQSRGALRYQEIGVCMDERESKFSGRVFDNVWGKDGFLSLHGWVSMVITNHWNCNGLNPGISIRRDDG